MSHIHAADRHFVWHHFDGLILIIFWNKSNHRRVARPTDALERSFLVVINEGRYNLSVVVGPGSLSHIYNVTILDSSSDHRIAFDSECEVGLSFVSERVVNVLFNVLLR